MVQEIDFRRDVEKEFGSKKKKLSIAAKAATGDSERPIPSIIIIIIIFLLRIQSSLPGVGFPQICSDSGLHACVWAQNSLTCRRAGDSKDASKPGILVSLQTARTGKFVS